MEVVKKIGRAFGGGLISVGNLLFGDTFDKAAAEVKKGTEDLIKQFAKEEKDVVARISLLPEVWYYKYVTPKNVFKAIVISLITTVALSFIIGASVAVACQHPYEILIGIGGILILFSFAHGCTDHVPRACPIITTIENEIKEIVNPEEGTKPVSTADAATKPTIATAVPEKPENEYSTDSMPAVKPEPEKPNTSKRPEKTEQQQLEDALKKEGLN